ncbi:chloride channel [Boletus edulis]|uniref:Chloride channel protein n=1 Tax=Boletus edulis BED1 TaxID=1328754 RepID=A0AAD4C139_BOLED|nr:chloride channel [Boletus edulis]KAF8444651.1 chloride channel [Boletus edulis BED1]
MSVRKRSTSLQSLSDAPEEAPPSGPLSGPSSVDWRRQRLLRIGSAAALGAPRYSRDSAGANERTLLGNSSDDPNYGSIRPTLGLRSPSTISRRDLPQLPNLPITRGTFSGPPTPAARSPTSLGATLTRRLSLPQRRISAYDAPLVRSKFSSPDDDINVRINGFRVWYSSFSSIDWLHDTIKDSVRFLRLRRGKSVRSRLHLAFDKSLGWIIVTIVGFLTAIIAFLVVRSEQWFFDAKYGYCSTGWWKAKRFCCPELKVLRFSGEAKCADWVDWSSWVNRQTIENDYVEFISYTFIAIVWATASCLLTIHLTASTSFTTRKDSGVLSPQFVNTDSKDPIPLTKRKTMYYAAGSGIPEIKTILSGFVIHGYLGGRTLFTKSFGLALSVGSGLSLGKEGPFVHIASCIGNIVSRFHRKYENNEAKRREILSAACAAGVAVAFGAPIGGTLFSLEEVSYYFPPKVMWRSFFCAMIAAITLRFLDPFGTGKLVLFQVTYDRDWHAYELVFFVLLGAIGGIYGAYFSKLNYRWSRDVRGKTWLKSHSVLEVVLVTLVTAMLCFLNPYTRMGGTELVYVLFSECDADGANKHSGLCAVDPGDWQQVWPVALTILVAMLIKGALTIVTFGIKLPAGIFIPTLGVGACAGRILGIVVRHIQWRYPNCLGFSFCDDNKDCVVPGLYAMVGAAAALSGVTRTTVSLAVIMFELTDTLTYAVPVMLAVLVAKTVADALEPKGIYDLVIELSQLPYLDARHEYLWSHFSISDVTDRGVDVIRIDACNTVESLRDQLQALVNAGHDDSGFPILRPAKDSGRLRMVGYIGAGELEHALAIVAEDADEEINFQSSGFNRDRDITSSWIESNAVVDGDLFDFSVYMDEAPLTIQSHTPLELLHQFFVKLGARYVVVTDIDGNYEGVIDKKTWLGFLSGLEEKS